LAANPTSDLPCADSLRERLTDIYDRLLAAYGPQRWWPGSGGFETVAGAILTQSAAWPNVEQALERLRAAGALTPEAILSLDEAELAQLVRPSGYFNAKARKLIAFCNMLRREFSGDLHSLLALPAQELRGRLLSTYGIGPETADDIVLYAAAKPSFVIDAYTRRIFSRLGIAPQYEDYESWRSMFMVALPVNATMFNEYHALIVRHAKVSCAKRPDCARCVLQGICATAADTAQNAVPVDRSGASFQNASRTQETNA